MKTAANLRRLPGPFLEIGSRKVPLKITKGRSRRSSYLRFNGDLTLEVVIPRSLRTDPMRLIRSHSDWIERELTRIEGSRRILLGDQVMFGGKYLRLTLTSETPEGVYPDFARSEVLVRTSDRRRLRELIRRWFLRETSFYVVAKSSELAPKLGVRPSRVDAREIDKWGYCTRSGRLTFSWQLIALPERLREYVVMHELAHLVHFDHSGSFKRVLSSVCPDFRDRESELDRVLPYERLAMA